MEYLPPYRAVFQVDFGIGIVKVVDLRCGLVGTVDSSLLPWHAVATVMSVGTTHEEKAVKLFPAQKSVVHLFETQLVPGPDSAPEFEMCPRH